VAPPASGALAGAPAAVTGPETDPMAVVVEHRLEGTEGASVVAGMGVQPGEVGRMDLDATFHQGVQAPKAPCCRSGREGLDRQRMCR